jgi:putative tryptophan/tyrosine transport system substrate-binding protein
MLDLRRRQFLTLLGGAAVLWPRAASAQQTGKLPIVGCMGATTPSAQSQWTAAFIQRLRELGWIEGRTIAVEYRWTEGRTERAAEIAAEFVQRKVDVIVTSGTGMVLAAKQATSVIPIVFASTGDPVGTGLVTSLARPGGNVTGLSNQVPDLVGKRLELLREVVPSLGRMALPRHFMSLSTHSRIPTAFASIPWRWLSGCRRCMPFGKGSKREV